MKWPLPFVTYRKGPLSVIFRALYGELSPKSDMAWTAMQRVGGKLTWHGQQRKPRNWHGNKSAFMEFHAPQQVVHGILTEELTSVRMTMEQSQNQRITTEDINAHQQNIPFVLWHLCCCWGYISSICVAHHMGATIPLAQVRHRHCHIRILCVLVVTVHTRIFWKHPHLLGT